MTADEETKEHKSQFDFVTFFTENIEGYVPKNLAQKIKDKMNFGLQKYGDRSYQSSLSNLMECSLYTHFEEEIIDAINYAAALALRCRILGHSKSEEVYTSLIQSLADAYTKNRDQLNAIKEKDKA